MIKNFIYQGDWFLPAAKDKKLKGILTYDTDEGITLELFGSFSEIRDLPQIKHEDIIQGITSESKQITLYRWYVSKEGGGVFKSGEEPGTPSTIYTVNYIFEGVHIDNEDKITFQKINAEIHNLGEWVDISGFVSNNYQTKVRKNKKIVLKYNLPQPINFPINNSLDGQFNFVVRHSNLSGYAKKAEINQYVELILLSKLELPLEEILKQLFRFQNFLILALYKRTYPIQITLYSDKFSREDGTGKSIRKKINLYFPIANRSKLENPKSFNEMLFGYGHIKDDFPTIIRNWYANYDLLEPAFNLLIEQFYNNERFNENTFLNLAQATETFHSKKLNHPRMPSQDFNKMKHDILNLVPEEYHDWLNEQFNFGNNLNLHTRLTEIIEKYSNETLEQLIGNKEDFIKEVKWSRNYYTHYSTDLEKRALKGIALFNLSEKMKAILVCAFLIEVGFEKEKLKQLLERNKYKFFYHLIKW